MSILIMSRVWAHSESTGSARLILLAIADFADDHGSAYPAVETLAKKARVSERTAQYALRELVQSGELAILEGQGPRGCNLYRVQSLQGANNDRKGVQDTAKGGATVCTQTVIEPSEEPSTHTPAPSGASAKGADYADEIYAAYPRKVGKLDALKAIRKALKDTPADVLLDRVNAFARTVRGKDPQYIPHPATWFNSGRYLDEPTKPAGTPVRSIPSLPEPPNWQAIIDERFPGSSFASNHDAGGRKWASMSPGDQAAVAGAVKPFLPSA